MSENEDPRFNLIKELLQLKGITPPTDSQLQILIDYVINIISSETGRDINPRTREDVELHFKGREYNLRHYPVRTIDNVYRDDTLIIATNYVVDYETGIIHFINPVPKGDVLRVEYTTQESDDFINNNIIPLMVDMIIQNMSAPELQGASSIKEGNTSINFDSNLSFSANINRRLSKLRRKGLTRML